MNKRHYEHTLPNIRGSLSNTYIWSSYDLLDETAKEEYQNSQREILDDDSSRSAMKNGQKKYIAGWTTNEAI